MLRALTFLGLVALSTTALAADALPQVNIEVDQQIAAKGYWSHDFRINTPQKLIFKATVRNAQPVNFYVMKNTELRNYIAAVGSLANHNFSYFNELYRESSRDFDGSAVLEKGRYSFVIENIGPNAANSHVIVNTSPASPTDKVARLPQTTAGSQGGGNGAGKYELVITRYTVSERKNNGTPWDDERNSADVEFLLGNGPGTGVTNMTRIKGGKHQDRPFGAGPEEDRWAFDWDGRGPVILVSYDKDMMSDDLIGSATVNAGNNPAREWVVLDKAMGSVPASGKAAVTLAWRKLGSIADPSDAIADHFKVMVLIVKLNKDNCAKALSELKKYSDSNQRIIQELKTMKEEMDKTRSEQEKKVYADQVMKKTNQTLQEYMGLLTELAKKCPDPAAKMGMLFSQVLQ